MRRPGERFICDGCKAETFLPDGGNLGLPMGWLRVWRVESQRVQAPVSTAYHRVESDYCSAGCAVRVLEDLEELSG